DAVEIGEAGGDAGEQAPRPLFELLQRAVEDAREEHEATLDRLLAQTEDRLLGAAERLLGRETTVQAVAHDLARRLDQPAADRALFELLAIRATPAVARQMEVEGRKIADPADGVELPLLLQLGL